MKVKSIGAAGIDQCSHLQSLDSDGIAVEMQRRQGLLEASSESIGKEIAEVEGQGKTELEAESKAFRAYTRGKVSEDVYQQEIGLIRTRRKWLTEQRQRLESQLAQLNECNINDDDLKMLRTRVANRLDQAAPEDRRFVLEAVGTQVLVDEGGRWEVEIHVPRAESPAQELQIVTTRPGSNYT